LCTICLVPLYSVVLIPGVLRCFCLVISAIFVFLLCSMILVFSGPPVSHAYLSPRWHGMLYMQFLDSCVSFSGLVLASFVMLCAI
jgi:hypothetical protein